MTSRKPQLDHKLVYSIFMMTKRIAKVLDENDVSVYLYGSVTMGDFKLGWSDIDILVLTTKEISESQANELVSLRQDMLEIEPDNPYYRLFEGGMLALDAFLTKRHDRVVYWGTSGQRVTDHYTFDSFCMAELLGCGILICGDDVRRCMTMPTTDELYTDIRHHCETIRQHVQTADRSLYSFGWLLDIARCIYTLRTGKIIAKTAAGEWALENSLCPDKAALEYALRVRREPLKYKNDESTLAYAETLGTPIQRFAEVLEGEMENLFKGKM